MKDWTEDRDIRDAPIHYGAEEAWARAAGWNAAVAGSEPKHNKNRDCVRAEEVLENYRRRAIAAELKVGELLEEIEDLRHAAQVL